MNFFALLVCKLARRIQPKDSPLDRCHVFLSARRESCGSLHISANRRQAFLKKSFPRFLVAARITFTSDCWLPRNSSSFDGCSNVAGIHVGTVGRGCAVDESVVSPRTRPSTAEDCGFHATRASSPGEDSENCATYHIGTATFSAPRGKAYHLSPAWHFVFALVAVVHTLVSRAHRLRKILVIPLHDMECKGEQPFRYIPLLASVASRNDGARSGPSLLACIAQSRD